MAKYILTLFNDRRYRGYKVTHNISRGEPLNIDVANIPSVSGAPYFWEWSMRQVTAGMTDYTTGQLIQTNSGLLATNSQSLLQLFTIPVPIDSSYFDVGDEVSFLFKVYQDIFNPTIGVEVIFKVVSVSPSPTSPGLLPIPNIKNVEFQTLNTTQTTALNVDGAGLDVGFNIDTTKPIRFEVNGKQEPSDQIDVISDSKIRINEPLLTVVSTDWIFFSFTSRS